MADYTLIIAVLGVVFVNFQGTLQTENSLQCELYHAEDRIYNETETCDNKIHDKRCFALWRSTVNEKNETIHTVIRKGCFQVSFDNTSFRDCRSECIQVIPYDKHATRNVSGFCCCNTNMCNMNFTPVVFNITESTAAANTVPASRESNTDQSVTVIVACSFFVALAIIMVVVVLYIYKLRYKKKIKYSATEEDEKEPPGPMFDLSGLHLQQLVGNGQYGSVWKASLNGKIVAVKVFRPQHRDTWLTERDVYMSSGISHPNILKFYVAVEREREDNLPEYLLVTEYHSEGSLKQYLQQHTFSWRSMCILGRSLAAGLAHLHHDDEHKASFVHRDLSSRNVLVKTDGTCVLSDFGFAMKMSGRESVKPSDDSPFITEVGTMRYMAPEVLDGAVNLRECHTSLKEIDVYAMSLVLWEITMRCTDIFGRDSVPDYRPPFEAELGEHICSEHIQDFVAKQKRRPGFPDAWKRNHPGLRTLKETIEDCWDQDGDARLSALCVQERFSELLKDYPNGLDATASSNVLPSVQQNFTSTHSQSLSGFGGPNTPVMTVATNPWAENSSSCGMTTV